MKTKLLVLALVLVLLISCVPETREAVPTFTTVEGKQLYYIQHELVQLNGILERIAVSLERVVSALDAK